MVKYVFAEDKILSIKAKDKADPQVIGEALEKISVDNGGLLTPKAVVEAARSPRNPLHRHFEWDDKQAAEQFRLSQARDIVASIHVESRDTENGLARAFLSIRDKDGTAYHSLGDVLASADLQSKVLAAAERDLIAFENRYKTLTDICDLVAKVRQQISIRRSAKHESRARA